MVLEEQKDLWTSKAEMQSFIVVTNGGLTSQCHLLWGRV